LRLPEAGIFAIWNKAAAISSITPVRNRITEREDNKSFKSKNSPTELVQTKAMFREWKEELLFPLSRRSIVWLRQWGYT